MNRSKVDFITSLLSNEKLSASHKEKLFPLILSEIKQAGDVDEKIWKEIEKIKQIILNQNTSNGEINGNPDHDPLRTAEKLTLFKTGNKLKWITHIYPNSEQDKFDYDIITNNAIEEFNSISKYLPTSLQGLIGLFLKPKKSDKTKTAIWYLGNAYKTWWSDDIKTWCQENKGLHPDTNEVLSRMIITPFKKSIEVRNREDLIEAVQHRLVKTHGIDIFSKLDLDFSDVRRSTRFFTGVDQLMSGIACLFSPILKRNDVSNKVKISTSISERNERYVTVVTIQHTGSNVEKEVYNENILNGDLLSAKEKFLSICDWTITANFSNGTFSIPILKSGDDNKIKKQDEKVEGFTNQLIFY